MHQVKAVQHCGYLFTVLAHDEIHGRLELFEHRTKLAVFALPCAHVHMGVRAQVSVRVCPP